MAVYDCFTFFNELKLLELRLELLYEIVDYFVIVELDKTQKGENKRYNLEENYERFTKYRDKIIYIKATDAPYIDKETVSTRGRKDESWNIERYQRNCIIKGLQNCKDDDLIIISDLDEIPNPNVIKRLDDYSVSFNIFSFESKYAALRACCYVVAMMPKKIAKFIGHKMSVVDFLDFSPISLEMDIYYYFFNCKSRAKGHYAIMTRYKNLQMPSNYRKINRFLPYICNAGWHFSYMGGIEKIKEKLNSIIEGRDYDYEYIKNCIERGRDLYGRKGDEFKYTFTDTTAFNQTIKDFINKYPEFYYNREGDR